MRNEELELDETVNSKIESLHDAMILSFNDVVVFDLDLVKEKIEVLNSCNIIGISQLMQDLCFELTKYSILITSNSYNNKIKIREGNILSLITEMKKLVYNYNHLE